MRHGVVDSSTATTVDVSLDGVIVTAFLLDGVVLTAGSVATLIQDGRRLVAVGGVATGPSLSGASVWLDPDSYGAVTDLSPLTDESDSTLVTSDVGDIVDGTDTVFRLDFTGVGTGVDVTISLKVRGSSTNVDPLPVFLTFGDDGGEAVSGDEYALDDVTWTTVTETWTTTGGSPYVRGVCGSANDILVDLTTVTVSVA